MKNYIVIWEGSMPLEQFKLVRKPDHDFIQKFIKKRDELWKKEKAMYDYIYNGELIFVEDIDISEPEITLYIGKMMYSDVLLAIRNETVKHQYGSLAFYIIIKSGDSRETSDKQSNEKILLGIKSVDSQVEAGRIGFIGGLFELSDFNVNQIEGQKTTSNQLIQGIQREVNEESGVEIDVESLLVKAIIQDHFHAGIILIIEAYPLSHFLKDNPKIIQENQEWVPNSLVWMKVNDLIGWDYDKLNFAVKYFVDSISK